MRFFPGSCEGEFHRREVCGRCWCSLTHKLHSCIINWVLVCLVPWSKNPHHNSFSIRIIQMKSPVEMSSWQHLEPKISPTGFLHLNVSERVETKKKEMCRLNLCCGKNRRIHVYVVKALLSEKQTGCVWNCCRKNERERERERERCTCLPWGEQDRFLDSDVERWDEDRGDSTGQMWKGTKSPV